MEENLRFLVHGILGESNKLKEQHATCRAEKNRTESVLKNDSINLKYTRENYIYKWRMKQLPESLIRNDGITYIQ